MKFSFKEKSGKGILLKRWILAYTEAAIYFAFSSRSVFSTNRKSLFEVVHGMAHGCFIKEPLKKGEVEQ